jgi:diaminopimelate decarboxylase/diaminopimelate epimerase
MQTQDLTARRLPLFPDTAQVTESTAGEQLTIAGCDLGAVAERHGTPLYIYDGATLAAAAGVYRTALAAYYPGESGITYAGKAFLCPAIAQWAERNGLWVDCTGLGELRIAREGGVARERIAVHGVNKSPADLAAAVAQAGTLVVDNLFELDQVIALHEQGPVKFPDLWLRFKPAVDVATHSHTQTGHEESKFGMEAAEIQQAVALCREHGLSLHGLHFHLGSQFRDAGPVSLALERMLDLMVAVQGAPGWTVCIGGGWGVAYHEDDLPHPDVGAFVQHVSETLVAGCRERGVSLPRLHLEPGRSLVARAGVALYRVGAIKRSAERRWLLLDGGLADNPRPALYGARYSALPVRNPRREATGPAWLAGPYCESGDVLIENLPLPDLESGELVAIPVSGAYQLSMASNYNGARRPAVLWLQDGEAQLIRARETPDDLVARDRLLWPVAERHVPEGASPGIRFHKYQALGNDYLVIDPADIAGQLTPEQIRRVCDRHYGVGSDGLLTGFQPEPGGGWSLLGLFNPDGGKFEKSGNGLRIFARFLWDQGRVGDDPFLIDTPGGRVTARVHPGGKQVTIQMGTISFDSRRIPVAGPPREVLNEVLQAGGQELRFCAATIGNPHCVVLCDEVSPEVAQRLGPSIEHEARFPDRTNVQFMRVLDRANIQIEIWERGAGYTLASGSSSCAAAAVAYRLGFCDGQVAVHMPGGVIDVSIAPDLAVEMTGAVERVCEGVLAPGILDRA